MENIFKQIKDTEEENRLTGDYRKYRPLNLSSMNINDREFSLIVDRLNACPHIWKADFSDNLIQGIPEKGFLFLKSIDLVANKLSKEEFLYLLQRDFAEVKASFDEYFFFSSTQRASFEKDLKNVFMKNKSLLFYEGPGYSLPFTEACLNRNRRRVRRLFFTHRGKYGFVLNRPEEVSFEKQILFDKGFCFSKKKKEIDFEARMPGKNKKSKGKRQSGPGSKERIEKNLFFHSFYR